MAALPNPRTHRPVRVILDEFLEKVIDREDEVQLHEVVAYARERFRRDEEFHEALLDDALGILVAEALRRITQRLRSNVVPLYGERDPKGGAFVRTEAGIVRREALDSRADEILGRMRESLGPGHRKNPLKMNRVELDYVIGQREAFARGNWRAAAFYRDLRAGLRSDDETPALRYTSNELDAIWRKHYGASDSGEQQLRIATK